MWSRWWSCGGGAGLLRQRGYSVFNGSNGYGGKLHPFEPFLLGLRDFELECGGGGGGRRGGVASFSVGVMKQMKRGMTSSTTVSSPPDGGKSNSSENEGGGGGAASNGNGNGNGTIDDSISFSEAKKLMRLVNVESLKIKLGMEGKEVIAYCELLEVCVSMGVARNPEEASAFAKVLDEAGVILLFRDKVYLHPDKVSIKCLFGPSFPD